MLILVNIIESQLQTYLVEKKKPNPSCERTLKPINETWKVIIEQPGGDFFFLVKVL